MSTTVATHVIHALHTALPPPPDDTQAALAARNQAAEAQYNALAAGDLHETQLAILHVAACAQALDCMRMAGLPNAAQKDIIRNRQQALAMMRAAHSTLRALRAAQQQRTGKQAPPPVAATPVPAPQPATPPAKPNSPLTAAEDYARRCPTRAARIRRAGGVPPGATYPVPPPEVIQALVTGTTKPLRRLDRLSA